MSKSTATSLRLKPYPDFLQDNNWCFLQEKNHKMILLQAVAYKHALTRALLIHLARLQKQ